MSIVVSCPACGLKLSVTEEHLGRQGKCSGCGTVFAVEDPSRQAPLAEDAVAGPPLEDATAVREEASWGDSAGMEHPYAPPRSFQEPRVGAPPTTPGVMRIGDGLSHGFQVLHSNVGTFLLVGLVFCAIQFGLGILQTAMQIVPPLWILCVLVSIVFPGPQLAAGLCHASFRQHDGANAEVGDLFAEFKNWGEIALLALVEFLITLAVILVPTVIMIVMLVGAMHGGRREPDPGVLLVFLGILLIVVLIGIAISLAFFWAYPALIDRRGGFWDAIKTSVVLTKDNLGATLVTGLMWVLLAVAGVFTCFIGFIYFVPAMYCLLIGMYRTAMVPGGGVPVEGPVRRPPEGPSYP